MSDIRHHRSFLQHEDFREWLDQHGFSDDMYRTQLDTYVWPAFKQYFEREKHSNVPKNHVEPIQVGDKEEKVNLGIIVNNIRRYGNFLRYEDFRKWLDQHRFSYDMRRTHLDTCVWPAFKQYVEREKHSNVPRNHVEPIQDGDKEEKVNLGRIVSKIRARRDFLQHEDFKMWLWCACFKLNTKDGEANSRRWKQAFGC